METSPNDTAPFQIARIAPPPKIDGTPGVPDACPNHQHPTYPLGVGITRGTEGEERASPPAYADPVMLPRVPQPMLATGGELPTGAGWAYELKWDGVRALAVVSQARPGWRLYARSGADITAGYPELAALAAAVRATDIDDVVLDGEVVALGEDGRP